MKNFMHEKLCILTSEKSGVGRNYMVLNENTTIWNICDVFVADRPFLKLLMTFFMRLYYWPCRLVRGAEPHYATMDFSLE